MTRRLGVVAFVLSMMLSTVAQAGIEPSPFKRWELLDVVERIARRLDAVATWREVSPEVVKQALALQSSLGELKGEIGRRPNLKVVGNALAIMDQVSAVMFNPQPEPPGVQAALLVLERLSVIASDAQPEPPANTEQALSIMGRIVAVAFNPQPEPPGRELGVSILSKIASVAFNPQPEPPAVVARVLSVLDGASAVMFNPQPEPPGRGTTATMIEAVTQMGQLSAR